MEYKHLVDKLIHKQKKIEEHIEKDMAGQELPPDLVEKREGALAWFKEADKKLGATEVPEMTPDIDPILDYSTKLDYYSHMFSEKAQSEITEFAELVRELFQMVKA